MMQTLAIMQDSVRALRSRYLFWITLAISLIAALALFGLIGFDETGWKVLWFESNPSDRYRAGTADSRDLVAWIFNGVYVRWWLSWIAIALALVSTASILPDFLAAGAIDLSLSKPISRVKLFALKVLGALLFVALQVSAGVLLAWFLMGLKIGVWLGAAFWAIPLITLQFLYLYSISVLVAVLTRSTLASLLITLVFWALCSGVQFAANQIDSNVAQADTTVERLDGLIDRLQQQAGAAERELTFGERSRLESYRQQRDLFASIGDSLRPWQGPTTLLETALPKTGDIQKILANTARAPVLNDLMRGSDAMRSQMQSALGVDDQEQLEAMLAAGRAGDRAVRAVPAVRSILSSLAMPLLALVAACTVFMRRDY